MVNNIEIIESVLKDILTSSSSQQVRQNLLLLKKKIDEYLLELENFYNKMENVSPIVSQYQAMESSKPTITYAIYKRLIYSETEIDSLLKQGYIILEKIRNFFINESIKYEIGLISEGKLYEFQLTMQQILNISKVSFNTRAKIDNIFKLRLSGGKKSLLNIYKQAEKTIVTDVSDSSSVFSAIYDYIHTQNFHGKKINKGNAYEAYKRIVANRKNRIPPSVSVSLIEETLTQVRKNTSSFVKGGDYLNSQIKFYSNAPSLATTNAIRNTLKQISNILQMVSNKTLDKDFKESINQIFIKTNHQVSNNIEEEGRKESQNYLNTLLKQLGFQI